MFEIILNSKTASYQLYSKIITSTNLERYCFQIKINKRKKERRRSILKPNMDKSKQEADKIN